MPPRSKAGNTLTCAVFGLLTGLWLNDTQTGLRGLPKSALEAFPTWKATATSTKSTCSSPPAE